MKRIYTPLVLNSLKKYPQMVFLVGPRQVGKTTIAKELQSSFKESIYLNWDIVKDRTKILGGQDFVEDIFPLNILRAEKPVIVFDEIHKYRDWKNYLKGFYDQYKHHYHIVVTGSARLDIYQKGGDSLMGRYFQYHIHPLSVSELLLPSPRNKVDEYFFEPLSLKEDEYKNLYKFGGFPDPFLQKDTAYHNLWQSSRLKQLIYEDIQSLSSIHEIALLEVLAEILKNQAGQMVNRTTLSKKIQVTVQTISRWIETLERFYYCFSIKPWYKNITRSLIKESKIYLWDYSLIQDEGERFENFIACHLIKFTQFWSDQGYGRFEIFYLRDADKKEVDFLIIKDQKPWMMVEAKNKDMSILKSIDHFQKQTDPLWALQVVNNMEFVQKSCFVSNKILVVPAETFLSQLI